MLDHDIIQQLKGIFGSLKSEIVLRLFAAPSSPDKEQMKSFLDDVASASPKISVGEEVADVAAPKFAVVCNGRDTGITFVGIPNGHEFTTLLLAILNSDGQGKNLPDDTLADRIRSLRGPGKLRTFVSLTCTNCPDVAQALNLVALYNPGFENEVIDGAVVPDVVKSLNISSVPTVYADDTLLAVGRSSLGELLDKLEAIYGTADAGDRPPVVRQYDVLVAGGGPAGATAAIYAARKGLRTALVAKTIGGQVKETSGIENLTSVVETTGLKLAADILEHLKKNDIDIFENRSVDSANLAGEIKQVVCGREIFEAPALIIATGAGWRRLGVPGEADHIGKGVAFCVHCDGPFFAGKPVAVVGGGNSGIEAALDLANICPEVQVFEFLENLKADEVLVRKVNENPRVFIHTSAQVEEVVGDAASVSGVRVKDRNTGEEKVYDVSGVFVQIGTVPNSAPFREQLPVTRTGEIIVDAACRTGVKNVYAAGDVTNVPYKQIVIAMGEGAKASLSAFTDRLTS